MRCTRGEMHKGRDTQGKKHTREEMCGERHMREETGEGVDRIRRDRQGVLMGEGKGNKAFGVEASS